MKISYLVSRRIPNTMRRRPTGEYFVCSATVLGFYGAYGAKVKSIGDFAGKRNHVGVEK